MTRTTLVPTAIPPFLDRVSHEFSANLPPDFKAQIFRPIQMLPSSHDRLVGHIDLIRTSTDQSNATGSIANSSAATGTDLSTAHSDIPAAATTKSNHSTTVSGIPTRTAVSNYSTTALSFISTRATSSAKQSARCCADTDSFPAACWTSSTSS